MIHLKTHKTFKQKFIYLKVAIFVFALVAAAASELNGKSYGGYGKINVDYSHVPYYNFDWQVKDDYYNDYGQQESRSKDETKTKWGVALPGKSFIKRDDLVNAEMHVSHSYGGDYKATNSKAGDHVSAEYKATDQVPSEYKSSDY